MGHSLSGVCTSPIALLSSENAFFPILMIMLLMMDWRSRVDPPQNSSWMLYASACWAMEKSDTRSYISQEWNKCWSWKGFRKVMHSTFCSSWRKVSIVSFLSLQMCLFVEATMEKWFWEMFGSWICRLSSGSSSQLPCLNQCIFTVLLSHRWVTHFFPL